MIDYHCHLLPGLDDGPETVDEALAMARALAAFGFREVCCTPHCIKGQYELSPVEVRDAVRRLQAQLDQDGLALKLHAGTEYYLDEFFEQFAGNLLPLGESRLVLCEAPPQAPPGLVAEMAGLIVIQGYLPLIAHPERSDVIWQMLETETADGAQGSKSEGADAESRRGLPGGESSTTAAGSWWRRLFARRAPLREDDTGPACHPELPDEALYQANLGAFVGYYGPKPQRRAYELLQRGVYHCLASDLHDARSAVGLLDLAREKFDFNPALQKLGGFRAPQGQGGSEQLAFW